MADSLPPIPERHPLVDETGRMTGEFLRWLTLLKQRSDYLSLNGIIDARTILDGTISIAALPPVTDAMVSGTAAIQWTKISKTGSSLADLTTRSATDLTSGNIDYARMPSGAGVWTGTPTISGTVTLTADGMPLTNYVSNLGSLSRKYLTLHAAELWVETLVAQNTMATIGGRILVGPTNILTVDAAAIDTSLTFKYNNFANGDRIYFEANGSLEWMAVTSSASGSAGAYVYTVTRNLDGSGANAWSAGDAAFNTGTTGKGFIDLYSLSGVLSGSGPTVVGNVRTGTTYSQIAARWAVGNLNGLYGYAAETYGAAFGDPSATNLTIDTTNGFRIRSGTTNKFQADTSGNLSIVGDLSIGTSGVIRSGATAFGTGTGYYLDYNGGTPRFRVGTTGTFAQGLSWDGTNLSILAQQVSLGSSGTLSGKLYMFSADVTAIDYSNPTIEVEATTADLVIANENGSNVARTEVLTWTQTVGSTGAITGGIQNTQAGAGNFARFRMGNNSTTTLLVLDAYSSAYTPSGTGLASGGALIATGAGGLSIDASSSGSEVRFYTNSTQRARFDTNGDFVPGADNTRNCGVPADRWALVRGVTITSGDLAFENGFTFTEAEKVGIAEPGIALLAPDGEIVAFFGKSRARAKGFAGLGDVDDLPYVRTTGAERARMDYAGEVRNRSDETPAPLAFPAAAAAKTNRERKP